MFISKHTKEIANTICHIFFQKAIMFKKHHVYWIRQNSMRSECRDVHNNVSGWLGNFWQSGNVKQWEAVSITIQIVVVSKE